MKIRVSNTSGPPPLTQQQARNELEQLVTRPRFVKIMRQMFDRSFVVRVEEGENGPDLIFESRDSGHTVMTVADVAEFLQTDRASVRRMTGMRAQARAHHPIPFVKHGAKSIRFDRRAIEKWWVELQSSPNGKRNSTKLALSKGRKAKRGKR
jgi:Helix-turn-helix domain